MQAAPAQLRDFAARYTAAWCSQDPTSVAGFYSCGGSLTVNNDVPAVGRNAIAEVAQSFMTAFPDMRLIMDELFMQGDRIEYHWTLIGHQHRVGRRPTSSTHQWLRALADWSGWTHRLLARPLREVRIPTSIRARCGGTTIETIRQMQLPQMSGG